MSKQYTSSKRWYAIHTYSGYEEKVAESIRQRAESLDMKDKIYQILVPKEKMIEVKNGKRKVVEKKIFQGYVLVQIKLTEDAWYIVRNTPGVTGFVGTGTDPSPVSPAEIEKIMKRMGMMDNDQIKSGNTGICCRQKAPKTNPSAKTIMFYNVTSLPSTNL